MQTQRQMLALLPAVLLVAEVLVVLTLDILHLLPMWAWWTLLTIETLAAVLLSALIVQWARRS